MHGFTLRQLILEHYPKHSSVKCCFWKYVLWIQRWVAFLSASNSLGRMGTLLPRKSFPVCISLAAITVAQALSVHASVKWHCRDNRTGDWEYRLLCEGHHNASGWCCLQLICRSAYLSRHSAMFSWLALTFQLLICFILDCRVKLQSITRVNYIEWIKKFLAYFKSIQTLHFAHSLNGSYVSV